MHFESANFPSRALNLTHRDLFAISEVEILAMGLLERLR